MALNLQNKYPGRFDPVSADYPQGKFKNRSSPTAQDGSYMERDWLNDWAGFFGALLSGAGATPNGNIDTARSSQIYNALVKTTMLRLRTGEPLPTSDIGLIWHDDYNSFMTWQTFDQNGANYTGYASHLIGSLLLDTQPTPRAGYIKSGVQNLSRATYAALRAWAMHNGRMVAPGVWAAGSIQCADNEDGTTFRVFDVRGEFFRAWDDGRGVDAGRENFSAQKGTIVGVDWSNDYTISAPLTTSILNDLSGFSGDTAPTTSALQIQTITSTLSVSKGNVDSGKAVVTRPRNTALLSTIKF